MNSPICHVTGAAVSRDADGVVVDVALHAGVKFRLVFGVAMVPELCAGLIFAARGTEGNGTYGTDRTDGTDVPRAERGKA